MCFNLKLKTVNSSYYFVSLQKLCGKAELYSLVFLNAAAALSQIKNEHSWNVILKEGKNESGYNVSRKLRVQRIVFTLASIISVFVDPATRRATVNVTSALAHTAPSDTTHSATKLSSPSSTSFSVVFLRVFLCVSPWQRAANTWFEVICDSLQCRTTGSDDRCVLTSWRLMPSLLSVVQPCKHFLNPVTSFMTGVYIYTLWVEFYVTSQQYRKRQLSY